MSASSTPHREVPVRRPDAVESPVTASMRGRRRRWPRSGRSSCPIATVLPVTATNCSSSPAATAGAPPQRARRGSPPQFAELEDRALARPRRRGAVPAGGRVHLRRGNAPRPWGGCAFRAEVAPQRGSRLGGLAGPSPPTHGGRRQPLKCQAGGSASGTALGAACASSDRFSGRDSQIATLSMWMACLGPPSRQAEGSQGHDAAPTSRSRRGAPTMRRARE